MFLHTSWKAPLDCTCKHWMFNTSISQKVKFHNMKTIYRNYIVNLFMHQINLRSQHFFDANLEVTIFASASSHLYTPVLTANNLLVGKEDGLVFVCISVRSELVISSRESTDSLLFLQKGKEFLSCLLLPVRTELGYFFHIRLASMFSLEWFVIILSMNTF